MKEPGEEVIKRITETHDVLFLTVAEGDGAEMVCAVDGQHWPCDAKVLLEMLIEEGRVK